MIDTGGRFNPSNKMQLASNVSQIFNRLVDVNEVIKTRQAQTRSVATVLKRQDKVGRILDFPSLLKEEIQIKPHTEIISFSREPVQKATVSEMENSVQEIPKPQPLTVQDPRYLQAAISAEKEPDILIEKFLKPDTTYNLSVSIGRLKQGMIAADESFPEEDILIDVRTPEEPLTIVFEPSDNSEAQSQILLLPKLQNSLTVNFDFRTPDSDTVFSADIKAFHKNRLIRGRRSGRTS
ncbi:hypothetical protein HK413_06730 [Mucilaginibacter sp. S1162]|uniref:Uncharacterized protein n=1 Tax=Mucilaginibacter humi TaxID=2732510 RepID=A0ABX1W2T3_9SPHI|nr:hypothetical protein [Mucilaginibacter humi]NNU33918.1 hypothetical protein [Mucilaginibacter humi]